LFYALLVPRALCLGVWALALAVLWQRAGGLRYDQVAGLGTGYPLTAISLVLANLSLAGLPLLAIFPLRLSLLQGLASTNPASALWALVGSLGLLVAGLRTLLVLIASDTPAVWNLGEAGAERFFLVVGAIALLILGIYPQWFITLFTNLAQAFQQLVP
jgi:NADH:ubiquinone oxidoreductase subunit 2 (subunit N)